MARDLKLEVLLSAVDKITAPLRNITRGSSATAQALKASRDQLKQLQAQQKDISSFRTLKNATQQTEQAMAASQAKVRELAQAMAATSTPTKAMAADFKRAQREAQALKQKHGEQQRELQELRGKLSSAGIGTRNLGEHERALRQRVAETSGVIDRQTASLKRATKQQELLTKAKEQYERTQGLAGSMAGSGAAGLATGTGILYAGARMVDPGLDFDASMSKVQALARLNKDSTDLAALREQARQLGASTQFSAIQAADAQSFLAMAGFDPKAIIAAMPSMLDMAKAGDLDLARAADISSNILSGFGIDPSETTRVADVLTKAFTTSNVNLEMLGLTMKYVGPVAKQAGMSLEETAAMAGLLGNVGIQADTAGTTLRSMLLRLSAPTGSAGKALKKLGVEALDAEGNVRSMPQVLAEVAKAVEKFGSGERLEYLKTIFGEEPAAGMAELIEQSGAAGLTKYLAVVKDSAGAARQTAGIMADNMRGDLDALGSAWADLGIQIQEQHNGPMREMTQSVTRLVGGLKTWIAENPALASGLVKLAVGFGMLVAAGGALTLVLASVLGPFAMVRYGLAMIGIKTLPLLGLLPKLGAAIKAVGSALWVLAANPIVLIIAAIAAAIALAAYVIWKNWDTLGPKFAALWAGIKATFSQTMDWFATLPTRFMQFGADILTGLANGITSALGSVKTAITGAGEATIGWFKEKLGIHSPSRVFAELGGYTMQGLDQGLTAGQGGPLKTIAGMGKQLAAAGALSVGMGVGSALAIDNRPPLAAAGQGGRQIVVQGDTITIQISGGGQNDALVREINRVLDERERNKVARVRSLMADRE